MRDLGKKNEKSNANKVRAGNGKEDCENQFSVLNELFGDDFYDKILEEVDGQQLEMVRAEGMAINRPMRFTAKHMGSRMESRNKNSKGRSKMIDITPRSAPKVSDGKLPPFLIIEL